MKNLLVLLILGALAQSVLADIQDPPANDYGPTRKLGRALANIFTGGTEIPVTIGKINTEEGNSAAASYGVVRGVGRSFARFGVGIYEFVTWPIPLNGGTYFPILPNDTHHIHGGYSEFPPELGYESKYPYVRDY